MKAYGVEESKNITIEIQEIIRNLKLIIIIIISTMKCRINSFKTKSSIFSIYMYKTAL